MAQKDIIGTREWHEAEELADRIAYEKSGEPDGCYYCGSHNHKTSDCHVTLASDVEYAAGYAYACGYQD
jgi:hypothetical protein